MLTELYKYFRILSLDIAVGACVCCSFVAMLWKVEIGGSSLISLGLIVWLLYTIDHLMDAHGVKHLAGTDRHRFHQKHFKTLSVLAFIIFISVCILLFIIPSKIVQSGLVLGSLTVFYFLILKLNSALLNVAKELTGSIIYTSGVFLIPFVLYGGSHNSDHYYLYIQFVLLALINLLEFAYFEQSKDMIDGHVSLAVFAGKDFVERIIWVLIVSVSVINGYTLSLGHDLLGNGLITLMTLTLLAIMIFKDFFGQREKYRIVGDSIFLYPLVIMLF